MHNLLRLQLGYCVYGVLICHLLWLQLQIWDTAGQEKFRSITQSYYRAAHGLILVYDVCSQNTFDALPQWITDIESFANEKVLSYLVGEYFTKYVQHVGQAVARSSADREARGSSNPTLAQWVFLKKRKRVGPVVARSPADQEARDSNPTLA